MRLVINLVLIALIAGLVWILYSGIQEPIEFKNERAKREDAVIARLTQIRQAQEIYRSAHGKFASSFDSLVYVLKNGKIMIVKVEGDPDDPSGDNIIRDTIYEPAMKRVNELGLKLDSLRFVPFSDGVVFDVAADTLTYQQTLVDVVEVGTARANYMGKYKSPRYKRYDNNYDPGSRIKFGDLYNPSLAGNWER